MSTDNSLPTPPSASASATPTPASTSATAAASSSQTADSAAAAGANSAAASTPAAAGQPADATATANGATGSGTAAAQQQSQQQPPPPTPAEILETVLQQIVSSNGGPALANVLLNFLPNAEAREIIFASTTPEGADPLEALDMAQHTIGILFILCVFFTFLVSLGIYVRDCSSYRCFNCRSTLLSADQRVLHPPRRLHLQSRSHTSRTSAGVSILKRRATRLNAVSDHTCCPAQVPFRQTSVLRSDVFISFPCTQ
jgi:hypothetical protein